LTRELLTFAVALVAGGIASVSGFGIGSLLTPLLALFMPVKLAVAVVSVPHAIGTALRFWLLRKHLDREVLMRFGIASAAGGLAGALLHVWFQSAALGYVLGGLLVFAGLGSLTGLSKRMRFTGGTGWIAGLLSGAFGGLVGNQGGIRSAALMGQGMSKETLVATATAIALLVDIFRMPVYAATQFGEIAAAWPLLACSTAGVLAGTLLGKKLLIHIPEKAYTLSLSLLILALGVWMLFNPGG
jgi:uncharacterized protein